MWKVCENCKYNIQRLDKNTAGHHYSKEASEAKQVIFPKGYDATKMFWLINSKGAFGARAGLIPVVKEVLLGLLVHSEFPRLNTGAVKYACDGQYGHHACLPRA